MSGQRRSREIENPKVGDSVVSRCGMIKVSLAADDPSPVTKLIKKRGSFNIQLYFEGNEEPDTIVFKTDGCHSVISTRLNSQIGQNQNRYESSVGP